MLLWNFAGSELGRPLTRCLRPPPLCAALLIVFLSAPHPIILFSFLLSQRLRAVPRAPWGVAVLGDPEENMSMPCYGAKTHQKDEIPTILIL